MQIAQKHRHHCNTEQGPKLLEKASRSKAAAFILNHLANPQGQPKSQIQVALIGHGRP
jgi:hypothetical protein